MLVRKLLDDGSMLGVCAGKALVRVDWDSKHKWSFEGPVNHDVDVLQDGRVIVPVALGRANFFGRTLGFTGLGTLSREDKLLEIWYPKRPPQRDLPAPPIRSTRDSQIQ